jgi:CubicO group peptidase (beta-lactamase class C family)
LQLFSLRYKTQTLNYLLTIIGSILLLSCFTRCNTPDESSAHTQTAPISFFDIQVDSSQGELAHRIDTFFKKRYLAKRFNGVALFAKQGKIIYHKAFGYANFSTKDSLKTDDAFQLASVSKTITAIAIIKLIENEQLRLDDTLQKHLPQFPYQNITIRHLLSHRSGLGNYMYFIDKIWPNKDSSISNQQMVDFMQLDTPMVYYQPNVRYHYCNTNYALLASIIEKVSKKTYAEYVQEHIFDPLGMENAFIYNRNNQRKLPQEVIGYNGIYRAKENIYLNGVVGDKGVYASTIDLLKLDQGLYDENFISQYLIEEAFLPQNPDLTRRNRDNYGLGWRIQKSSEMGKVVYHSGWWKGFKSYFIRMLDKDQTIIVLTNVTRGGYLDKKAMQELFEMP